MVLVPIARELFRQTVKFASRYYRYEGQAFNKLYRGFPQSKTIGRGVRHGLTSGSVIGSLINEAPDSPGNGNQKTIPSKSTTNQPYQTRRGFTARSRARRDRFCYPPRVNRYSYSRSRKF